MNAIIGLLLIIVLESSGFSHQSSNAHLRASSLRVQLSPFRGIPEGGFLQRMQDNFNKEPEEPKTELDLMREALEVKPWRSRKVKYLTYEYHPWKDNWKERFRDGNDPDTIHLYSVPEFRPSWDRTRVSELWFWPWLWTKAKADRLGWIHKLFYNRVESMSVQEHMELDAFFSEFDMPTRWGLLRIKELDVLNVIALNLVFFTDFNGIPPTDLGLRPDGTVRLCASQFHNCITSSASPEDTDHYAPPFKWSRAKSPDQALEEVKDVYQNYPKRGLRWSSGWIDRGGWKPQQFGGNYFYAQADSLAWRFTDDIELVVDTSKREVQFRSSARLGTTDWDVQRLRYNQFARMLEAKGGWQTEELPRLNYLLKTPVRLASETAIASGRAIELEADRLVTVLGGGEGLPDDTHTDNGAARRLLRELGDNMDPVLAPLREKVGKEWDVIREDPSLRALRSLADEARREAGDVQDRVQQWRSDFTEKANSFLLQPQPQSQSTPSDEDVNLNLSQETGSDTPTPPSPSPSPSPSVVLRTHSALKEKKEESDLDWVLDSPAPQSLDASAFNTLKAGQ